MAQLVVVDGPAMGRTYQVGGETTLGTHDTNRVCIADRRASEFEARILLESGVFYIEPIDQKNTLLVNGCTVSRAALQHGDMVTIGDTMLLFDMDDEDLDQSSSGTTSLSLDLHDSSVYRKVSDYEDTKSLLRTFELEGRDEKKLAIIYQFSNDIASIYDLQELGDKIIALLQQVFPADRAMVYIQDEYRRKLIPISTWSRNGGDSAPQGSKTIIREALKSRQGLLSADAMDDDRFLSGQSIVEQNIRSAMCVPMIHNDEVIGLIHLDTGESSRQFERADLDLLNGIALQAASAIQHVRSYSRRKRYTENLISLAHATQKISSHLKENRIVREIYQVCNLLTAEKCSLLLAEGSGENQVLRVAFAVGLDASLWSKIRVQPGEGVAGYVFENGEPLLVQSSDAGLPPGVTLSGRSRYQTESCLIVPVFTREGARERGERIRGVLCAADKVSEPAFNMDDREVLVILANQLGIALNNADLYKKATVDVLTRVYVRRYLFQRMEDLIPNCQSRKIPLALMMMDLDHFKQKNDTYGHTTGDMLLREMGLLIRRSIREQDIPARYGGEEFAVLLYDCPLEKAKQIGERLREMTEKHVFNRRREPIHATISIGISKMEADDTPDAIIKKADDALYSAKEGGRNQVRTWGEQVTG